MSDRKLAVDEFTYDEFGEWYMETPDGNVEYYDADVTSTTDYYPYGMTLRSESDGGNYRYGYQGSELDDEVKGKGNSYTTYFRQLDPMIGRWLSIDPKATAWDSPYSSMVNNPIRFNDPMGDSIPAVFTDANGKKLDNVPESVREHYKNEYGVIVGYNSKTEMLYYEGEADPLVVYENISKSAKIIFVNALKDTKTGKHALKAYGRLNFGYNLIHHTGSGITGGAQTKTRAIFNNGFILGSFREVHLDLEDFDFNDQGAYKNYTYHNVDKRTWNFARTFEHEWMGHALGKVGDGRMISYNYKPGPCVSIVNSFRIEMGLQIRLNYGIKQNGAILFGDSLEEIDAALENVGEGKPDENNYIVREKSWIKK